MTVHPIPPVYDADSEILILGSFPSVKSRESMFYYGHPQNRFWKVLAALLGQNKLQSIGDKRQLLLNNGIALWDVIKSCEIQGSSDSSVTNVTPNDISEILAASKIKRIYVNGKCAEKYYNRYIYPTCGIPCITLPSTSPANAVYTLEKLCEKWSVIVSDRLNTEE